MNAATDHLDDAYEELRAWCHTRPDCDDPLTGYATLGSITRIAATLTHIVDVTPESTGRATGSDDGRNIPEASDEIRSLTEVAVCALYEAKDAVSEAHEVVSHPIFALDDQV